VSVDEGSVRGLPGVVKVVVRKNFVGVVAEKPWQAIQAAGKLKMVPFTDRAAMKKLADPVMADYAKEIGATDIYNKINSM